MGSWRDNEALMDAVDGFKQDAKQIAKGEFVCVPNPGDQKRMVFRKWRVDALNEIVAKDFGIPIFALVGREQFHDFSTPRHVCWQILYRSDTIRISLKQIGASYDRDHSTILTGIKRVERKMVDDLKFFKQVQRLRRNWEALGV